MTSDKAALEMRLRQLEIQTREKDAEIMRLEAQLAAMKTPRETFYITTAIHYTNGTPHMGHAYENVTTDVIARYHRAYGRDVFFLTGTDEHGQKIDQTAQAQGIRAIDLCDKYAGIFRQLTTDLNMSNDDFIRTTSERHKQCAQHLFEQAEINGISSLSIDVCLGGLNRQKRETFRVLSFV